MYMTGCAEPLLTEANEIIGVVWMPSGVLRVTRVALVPHVAAFTSATGTRYLKTLPTCVNPRIFPEPFVSTEAILR